MKYYLKKLLIVMMILVTIFSSNVFLTDNYASAATTTIDLTDHVQKFAEQMAKNLQINSIRSIISGNSVYFTYDNNGNRITKSDGENNTYYYYDEYCNLVEERNNYGIINYIINNNNETVGFIYNNVKYYYTFDNTNSNITEIKTEKGVTITKYKYDLNNNASVLGEDANGNWIDMTNDDSFIGNINPYRYAGFYYDKESGYYYYGKRYYNAATSEYYVSDTNISSTLESNDLLLSTSSEVTTATIDSMATLLLNDPSIGNPISTYSETWYSNDDSVELTARLINAENNLHLSDHPAIAWVLINRYNANASMYGGQLMYDIITKKSQFSSIHPDPVNVSQTECANDTYNARRPVTGNASWSSAVWHACAIALVKDRTSFASLVPKPTGIDKQCNFINTTLAHMYMTEGTGCLKYNGINLSNVTIVSIKANMTNKVYIDQYNNYMYNVFFSYTNDPFK